MSSLGKEVKQTRILELHIVEIWFCPQDFCLFLDAHQQNSCCGMTGKIRKKLQQLLLFNW